MVGTYLLDFKYGRFIFYTIQNIWFFSKVYLIFKQLCKPIRTENPTSVSFSTRKKNSSQNLFNNF